MAVYMDINSLEQFFTKMDTLIANRYLRVIDGIWAETDRKKIFLPFTDETKYFNSNETYLAYLKGLNYHELAHCLFTVITANDVKDYTAKKGLSKHEREHFFNVLNMLEDIRIENIMATKYPYTWQYLEFTNITAIKRLLEKRCKDNIWLATEYRLTIPSELKKKIFKVSNRIGNKDDVKKIKSLIKQYITFSMPVKTKKAKEILKEKLLDIAYEIYQKIKIDKIKFETLLNIDIPIVSANIKDIEDLSPTLITGDEIESWAINEAKTLLRSNYSFKIIEIGDTAVGKTAIKVRFTDNYFKKDLKTTLGVDFGSKEIKTSYLSTDLLFSGTYRFTARMNVWDAAGQEMYDKIRGIYFKDAKGALICYDINNRLSFEHLDKWVSDLEENLGKVPVLLVGNKTDLERKVSRQEGLNYAIKHGFLFVECSAKTGENVDDMFEKLAIEIFKKEENIA